MTVAIDPGDLPFLPPPDKVIALDLPPPLSVNRTRRINWAAKRGIDKWLRAADMHVMANGGVRRLGKLPGQFEVRIVINEKRCKCDTDNVAKILIDYCRRLQLIVDDSPKYMRRLIIEWGDAPSGCRVTIREWGA